MGAGEPRKLPPTGLDTDAGSFFADGRRLLLWGHEPGHASRLYVLELPDGKPKPISPEGVSLLRWRALAPDGRSAVARAADGTLGLYPTDGGEPRPLPGATREDVPIRWTADGRGLYVQRGPGVPARVDLLDVASGKRRPWKELTPPDPAGVLAIGPILLSADGLSYVYSYRRIDRRPVPRRGAAVAARSMAEPAPPKDPVLDIRVRWRAGQVLLGFAGVMALVALSRPLAAWSPAWLKAFAALALGLGVSAAALLASLRGHKQPETIALHAFLVLSVDALGQLDRSARISRLAADGAARGLARGGRRAPARDRHRGARDAPGPRRRRASVAAAARRGAPASTRRPVVAAAIGYFALALAVNRALAGEKRRLSATLAELARLKHGIDQLADEPDDAPAAPRASAAEALRQVSDEGRRARQLDRASELDLALGRVLDVALEATAAHAVLYFDLDRQRELAHLRVMRGPAALVPDCAVPLGSDPFSFLIERGQTFYATDFKRLLFELPWYRGRVEIGTLVAVPVRVGDVIVGTLVADQLEIQAFTGREPRLLAGIAELAAEAIRATRASLGREELDAEFKAVYPISQRLAMLAREGEVRELLLRSARHLAHLEGGAVVMSDDLETRYVVEAGFGWHGRVPEARGGARRAHLGGVGAAQRRGGVPAREPEPARRAACRCWCSTSPRGRPSRCSRSRCARAAARSARWC